jgi:hypothetical protein
VKQQNKIISIIFDMILNFIRDRVDMIGEMKLGILRSEKGTHLIRSIAAMAMYLAGVPIFLIMLIRQWSSTAFLKYITKQVHIFSHGISSKLLKVHSFKHIQNPTTTNPMESIVGNLYLLLMG